MGFLDKLFGKGGGAASGTSVDSAVETLAGMYADPEVKSEGGISITSRQANEIRDLGRSVHKAGGREAMIAVREGLRQKYSWAVSNLETIWSSLPEWKA